MGKYRFFLAMSAMALMSSPVLAVDYGQGVFIVNEDWYGHQNSTVNYLLPDAEDGEYWHYRVIQTENPGIELGCTNQYGAIWKGKFYLIAKQEKDPGASIAGGRITVADAKTMKVLHQSPIIDPSGSQCDGRGFIGVDEHKGYISSSNGIWILDLDTYQVKGQVKGSANPNAGNDKPNNDPTGSLYHGQTGSMVAASGKIFAAHQQYGLLVIDPDKDEVVSTVSMEIIEAKAGIGSVVKSKDGMLWVSVAKSTQGTGVTLPCLIKVDPTTLETHIINIADGLYPPANSWYAWTPDAFCASEVNNALYWKGGLNRWFSGTKIFKYDIDRDELSQIIDLETDGEGWQLYGCSMRVHPVTDEIYMSLYHDFNNTAYITRRYDADGHRIKDYQMISNYWFPSLPVFPESNGSVSVSDIPEAQAGLDFRNGEILASGLSGQTIEIYNTSGMEIYSAPDTVSLSVSDAGH